MKKKKTITRRNFLALTGASGGAVLFNAQNRMVDKLIPYLNAPEYPRPGEWAFYLSTCRECPAGCGLMLWHRDGRITKAEGNPENPVNKGKLCIRGQSSVMGEYDADRVPSVLKKTVEDEFSESSWDQAFSEIKGYLHNPDRVVVISDMQTGSFAGLLEEFTSRFHTQPLYYEAFNYESMRKANREIYGMPVIPRYKLNDCDLIVSFGVDFLETWLSPVEYATSFSGFHSLRDNSPGKLVYFGSSRTLTAVNSDEFVIAEPGREAEIIAGLINRMDMSANVSVPGDVVDGGLTDDMKRKLDLLAEEIKKAQNPVILAGRPEDRSQGGINACLLANRLNHMLGSERNINFSEHHALSNSIMHEDFIRALEAITEKSIVFIHNTNPVYSIPGVEKYLEKAGKIIYAGTIRNETSRLADWFLPVNYYLEDWGDYEAWKGTISLIQPAMKPIFETMGAGDIFLRLMGREEEKAYRDIVRENWKKWAIQKHESGSLYTQLGKKGFLTSEVREVQPSAPNGNYQLKETIALKNNHFHFNMVPSHFFFDGRLANRGWLQEIPHPVSNLVWQGWVDMNTHKASEMDIRDGDIVKINAEGSIIEAPVRLTESIHENTIAMDTGQGHRSAGKNATGIGANAFKAARYFGNHRAFVKIEKTANRMDMLYLNAETDQYDRELLRHEKLEDIRNGNAGDEEVNWPMPAGYKSETDLYKGHEHNDHRWGMVIDLQKCIGCKACEAACYAENNIPVVGRENAMEGREMSWLKVLPYKIDETRLAYLPLPCQHCDSAPCEPVCPVYASVHTEEGLNAQIYNRCIGTRYCSNNCPYKVRRFNWINIKHDYPATLQLNPEVTVRERGVMEKCTFCVQRIRSKEYQAKIENRKLKDGEIIPACAQTCPTGAITFGDLKDENSMVRKMIEDRRRYQLLNELNTKTAVIYLKKVTF